MKICITTAPYVRFQWNWFCNPSSCNVIELHRIYAVLFVKYLFCVRQTGKETCLNSCDNLRLSKSKDLYVCSVEISSVSVPP